MYSIIYMLSAACIYSMAVVTPSIVREFSLNPALTQLLTAPAYVVAFFCTIAMALSSDRHRERGWHFAGPSIVCSTGLAWFSANIGGHTKRGVATAVIISIGNCGGAVGGQVYRGNDAAHSYVRGHGICAAMALCGALVTLSLKHALVQENKRRECLTREEFEREAQGEDLCDNHPSFRYWT
ncbi:hypothetical protein BG003_010436 [Podila horticola]|nr:hypothetical protein BG003_010436 [Podila horticola]